MHIVIFGASGSVGKLTTEHALKNGHTVTAFVHTSNPFGQHSRLTVIKGSIYDTLSVRKAIEGCDAVISTLGSWKTREKTVVSDGIKTICAAMEDLSVTRIILLTGSGAYWSGDRLRPIDATSHFLLKLINNKVLQDGEAAIATLEASALDWTIIRSPAMKDGATQNYLLNNVIGSPVTSITRQTVAQVLVDQLDNSDCMHQAPVIHVSK